MDECRTGTHECQFGAFCQDTHGSYTCGCPRGYYIGADRRNCIDIDECELGYKYVCSHGCVNHPGTYECTCPGGYILQSLWICYDIDECSARTHRCDLQSEARCLNTGGSYVCKCPHGFRTDASGWRCVGKHKCTFYGTIHL